MAEGGFENPSYDPFDHDDDDQNDDDDDDGQTLDETTPFVPGGSSTPGPQGQQIEMQTMHKEKSGLPKPDKTYIEEETSFGGTGRTSGRTVTTEEIEKRLADLRNFNTKLIATEKAGKYEQLLSDEEKQKEIQKVKDKIKKEYPEVDFGDLGEIRFATNFKKYKAMDVVVVGPDRGETKIVRNDGTGLLKDFLGKKYVQKLLVERL